MPLDSERQTVIESVLNDLYVALKRAVEAERAIRSHFDTVSTKSGGGLREMTFCQCKRAFEMNSLHVCIYIYVYIYIAFIMQKPDMNEYMLNARSTRA